MRGALLRSGRMIAFLVFLVSLELVGPTPNGIVIG